MEIYDFIWAAEVVEKIIVKHGVLPDEVEQIFQGKTSVRSHKGVYVALGRTMAGRHLFVVFKRQGKGTVRIITARDMTTGERRLYQKEI